MSSPVEIHVPRENVNDESVKLVEWLVADNVEVQKDQAIAEIETSKSSAQVFATHQGILKHAAKVGTEVAVGGLIAYVQVAGEKPVSCVPEKVQTPQPVVTAQGGSEPTRPPIVEHVTRFSNKAMALMREHNLSPTAFASRELVSANDILEHVGKAPKHANGAPPPSPKDARLESSKPRPVIAATGVPVRSEELPRSKQVEARYLSAGLQNTLPSVVTLACPTRGLRAATANNPILQGQTLPLMVFEIARLLKKHPVFNAYHSGTSVNYYQQVNVGIAFGGGNGLKVPVIRDADTKTLAQISDEIRELLVRYLDDSLPIETLSGGTFTITDLSGDQVFAFHPLINQGQSAILGIGGEFFGSAHRDGFFNLILAFDHQLTEGRQAARLLNDLKTRICGYESALSAANKSAEKLYCDRCMIGVEEIHALEHYLVQCIDARGETRLVCSRCLGGRE